MRRYAAIGVGLVAAVTLTACGGGSGSGTTNSSNPDTQSAGKQKTGGTLKVVEGTAPDSLDPDFGYTTQAAEALVQVYIPLLSYADKAGTAGTQLIPGLAQSLPTVTNGGKTYTLTLRKGLTYSDGSPIKASDFTHAIERSIKLPWGGSSFFTGYIKGAAAYGSKNGPKTISGITTDDSTGKITINLTQPYGAFSNILAFEASAPVPSNTPMKVLSAAPPIGDGPYKFSNVQPSHSYTLVKNPKYTGSNVIPGIGAGYVNEVDVTVNTNTNAEAQEVLNNQQDIFDPADSIPAQVLPQAKQQTDRYTVENLASTYYFFMNTKTAPFNNVKAREAVDMATDRTALARLSAGSLVPGCHFLPPTIPGHDSNASCVNSGDPNTSPSAATVAKAKQLVKSAGLAGTKVTVWSEQRVPRDSFCTYLNGLLNQLGFKSSIKSINDTVYFPTIGNLKNNPQIGFADWSQDFPNPSDFYLLLSKAGIQTTNNENFGQVDDPKIESQLSSLNSVPAGQLNSVASKWQALDKYVSSQSYMDVFGYSTAPKFTSTRVDYAGAIFNPVNYMLFNTVSLK
ncbi:ABC transporter substrate-binding protein [Jatrophihabitans endophyticus]|uniref:ABC transporter substrate-binding protein n=1 Tax=Jatrophihabitans endophyticus TaxID=1206085 RepID=UPI0019F5EABD|nr:ABC transporter substrate-binding protein [Jatrophihabitans endophyticus]MBE7186992.1 hypothetical protein [Jatrophihabitans endophyticus]